MSVPDGSLVLESDKLGDEENDEVGLSVMFNEVVGDPVGDADIDKVAYTVLLVVMDCGLNDTVCVSDPLSVGLRDGDGVRDTVGVGLVDCVGFSDGDIDEEKSDVLEPVKLAIVIVSVKLS